MFPNIFSISPTKIAIEKGFTRLKDELLGRGYEVFEVDYSETSKLGGLLRCSTLPLKRKAKLFDNAFLLVQVPLWAVWLDYNAMLIFSHMKF